MNFFKNFFKSNDDSIELEHEDVAKCSNRYNIQTLKLVGFQNLDDDDKDFVIDELEKGSHLYIRYNFLNNTMEFYSQTRLVGLAPDAALPSIKRYKDDSVLAAVIVKAIGHTGSNHGCLTVDMYIESNDGFEELPAYPLSARKLSVVETDYWTGEQDLTEEWALSLNTDELTYRFKNLYPSKNDYEQLSSTVDIWFSIIQKSYFDGNCRTKEQLEEQIKRLDESFAKEVLRKRVESYMDCRGFEFEKSDEPKQAQAIATEYQPYFTIKCVNPDGEWVTRTINHHNMNMFVVGLKYRENYEDLLHDIRKGTKLIIKHDSTNDYDDSALGFYLEDDRIIGYVPKKYKPFVELFLMNSSLTSEVTFVEDTDVDVEIPLNKNNIDASILEKYNMIINKVTKEKYKNGVYQEISSICTLDELSNNL
ncbi:HIRAN domain-containing protein [Prevotella sp.]|uniref:HIRAN domain-containing protein n=1 Tax=Prevotella sp. TaxID=59823 RepID=UPI003DA34971